MMDFAPPIESSPVSGDASTTTLRVDARVLLIGILAVAAGLRFSLLGQNSIWGDEAWVAVVTQVRWREVVPLLRAVDAHPPLYFLLMKAWTGIAGTGEIALRAPSAFFSWLAVLLTYVLMRRVSPEPMSLLGALVVSVSPLAVMAGQEARMYPLLGALTLGATLALGVGVERGGVLRWGTYVALATLLVYTHYLGFLVLAAQGIWVAWFERRHLRTWLVGMAVVAVLYAPWVPSLWFQVIQGRGWPAYRNYGEPAYQRLAQLFGLLTFGGSLFGMPTYFFLDTPLGPVEELVVLLPFLVVLWQGVAAFAAQRRTLAFLGLVPTVVIGVMLALSLVKPVFLARWFSFLVPFYAMFLARGILDAADRVRGRRGRIAALLTVGLLLYGVPVLHRYYFDPAFRPYQWRAAADLVRTQVRPGDFFLFGDDGAWFSFTYYLKAPYPNMRLLPDPDFAAIRQLAARYPRVWLVYAPSMETALARQTLSELSGAYQAVAGRAFNLTVVYLLQARPPQTR